MPDLGGRELLRETERMMREVLERERRLQQDVTARALAPFDAVFDLLADTGTTLRKQAEALEAAGRALEESAALVRVQAERYERTIGLLRTPAELVKDVAGVERRRPVRGREHDR